MKLVRKPDDHFIDKSQVTVTKIPKNKPKKTAPGVTEIVDETSKVPEQSVEQLPIQEESPAQNTDEQFTEEAKVTVTKLSKKKPKKPATEVTDIMDETSEVPKPSADHLSDQQNISPLKTDVKLLLKPNEQLTEETQVKITNLVRKKSKKTAPGVTEIVDKTSEVPEQSVEQLPIQEDSSPQNMDVQSIQNTDEQFTEVTVTKLIKKKPRKSATEVTDIIDDTSEVPELTVDQLSDQKDIHSLKTDVKLVLKPNEKLTEETQVTVTNLVRKKSKKTAPEVIEIVDETSKVPELTFEKLPIKEDSPSQNTNVQSTKSPDEQFTEETKVTVTKLIKKQPKKPATEVTDIMDETSEVPEPTVDRLPDREDSSSQEIDMELVQTPDDNFIEKSLVTVTKIPKNKPKKTAPGLTEIADETSKVPEQSVEQLPFQEDITPQDTVLQLL